MRFSGLFEPIRLPPAELLVKNFSWDDSYLPIVSKLLSMLEVDGLLNRLDWPGDSVDASFRYTVLVGARFFPYNICRFWSAFAQFSSF